MFAVLLGAGEASAAQLTLSWIDNSEGFAAFLIERSDGSNSEGTFTAFAEVAAGVTSYVDASVVDGRTYCYRIQAYDVAGVSAYSNIACGAPGSTRLTAISVTKSGTGAGRVTSTPAGIDCGGTCAATYSAGTSLSLLATPGTGSAFVGWSERCTGTDTCTIAADGPVSVTATFELVPYAVRVINSGWGAVMISPSGIVCGFDCTASELYGTTVTLTAIPKNVASTFVGWSGDCTGDDQTCTITVTGSVSVSALFKEGYAP